MKDITVVAADVGGTKTLLGCFSVEDRHGPAMQYDNAAYPTPEQMLSRYLAEHPAVVPARTILVIAVAGPVKNHAYCSMTNLAWVLDAEKLRRHFDFAHVLLLNDLEATALAMPQPAMAPHLHSLNGGTVDFHRPVTVISIGTGLGQALLLPQDGGLHRAVSAEGGHKSMAPFDLDSAALVHSLYVAGKAALSWEELISGIGMPFLYRTMFPAEPALSSNEISQQAATSPASRAAQCLQFFTRALYAEAGNLALQYWSEGGVILAGGVAQHIAPWLRQPSLQETFFSKANHREWLKTVPLALCDSVEAALLGAAAYGRYHAYDSRRSSSACLR